MRSVNRTRAPGRPGVLQNGVNVLDGASVLYHNEQDGGAGAGRTDIFDDDGDVYEYVYTNGTQDSISDILKAYATYNTHTGLIEVEVKASDSGNWSPHASSGVDFYNNANGEFACHHVVNRTHSY